MKCYFSGDNLHHEKLQKNKGVISFAIPDYGVVYRCQYQGDRYECEYAAAIALVRFIQLNQNHFKSKKLQFLSDSAMVVYQVKKRIMTQKRLKRFRDLLFFYQRKFGFELDWIPTSMNRAQMTVDQNAINVKTPKLNYDIFEESRREKRVWKNRNKGKVKIAG